MSQRILVVDDDKDHAESIADLLALRGYAVDVAFSGEDAMRRFGEVDFDVTLMDVRLPGMNGVETFLQFRKIRPGAQVIMMTGLSVEQLIAQAVAGGAVDVLYKPFAMGDLLNALKKVQPRGLVLVADDDLTFVESASKILAAHGYRVDVARTGAEALDKILSNSIDCLILDLGMPVMSGLEVYLQLREVGCLVPTILVANCAEQKEAAVKWLNSEQILTKPFDPAILLTAVKNALDSRYDVQAA
jgi:two-component system response regulator HydG